MTKITVTENKFHGDRILYHGRSEAQAIKMARKHDCHACKCGGPMIERNDGSALFDWNVTAPFDFANNPFWERIN